jgi:molybdate transport system substrate-binding protein
MKHLYSLMMKSLRIVSATLLITGAIACGKSQSPEKAATETANTPLRVYAAAGARPVTDDICDSHTQKSGIKVERNYASSGTLAHQLAAGADADLFLSANKQWIDYLNERQLLDAAFIQVVAKNALVIIAPKDASVATPQFSSEYNIAAGVDHIAVGDPAYVPVGKYTDQIFTQLNWTRYSLDKSHIASTVHSA